MGRGDSRRRSRSPRRDQRRHEDDLRLRPSRGYVRQPDPSNSHHRRAPRRSGSSPIPTRRPAPPSQDPRDRWENYYEIPETWKPSHDFLDTNLVYGLALPRQVISTSVSRNLGIDNVPIHEVKLVPIIHNMSQNWCLRLLANGKATFIEMFRSRQECFFASALMKLLRDQQVDFNQLLAGAATKHGLSTDLTQWSARKAALEALADFTMEQFRTILPQDPSNQLMERLRRVEEENARLRTQIGQSAAAPEHAHQPDETAMPGVEANKNMPNLSPPATLGALPTPAGPSTSPPGSTPTDGTRKPGQQTLPFSGQGNTKTQALSKLTELAVRDRPAHLESTGPKNHTVQSINAWMKLQVPDTKHHEEIDRRAKEFKDMYDKLDAGQAPSLQRMLVGWGMEPSDATKFKPAEALRLLTILNHMHR